MKMDEKKGTDELEAEIQKLHELVEESRKVRKKLEKQMEEE